MNTHRDLDVYKLSIELVTNIYQLTSKFPQHELFGLTSQIRRSAVSIPSNIAEGAARNYKKVFIQFLHISLGSASELETQLHISMNLNYLKQEEYEILTNKLTIISKMLVGLIKSLKKPSPQ